jgi:hypothetical protein
MALGLFFSSCNFQTVRRKLRGLRLGVRFVLLVLQYSSSSAPSDSVLKQQHIHILVVGLACPYRRPTMMGSFGNLLSLFW